MAPFRFYPAFAGSEGFHNLVGADFRYGVPYACPRAYWSGVKPFSFLPALRRSPPVFRAAAFHSFMRNPISTSASCRKQSIWLAFSYLKTNKKRGFCQKSAFFGKLVKKPTGFLNKSNVSNPSFLLLFRRLSAPLAFFFMQCYSTIIQ
jgi:hypothetical protein